jgi:SAM-dependent methyltransferase
MNGKLVIDFGSGGSDTAQSAIFSQSIFQNCSSNNFYLGYDTDARVQDWLRSKGCFYDFFEDDSKIGQIDMILGNQVYEHLDTEERINFLRRAYELLKPSGKLILAFPFNLYNMNFKYFWEDITHKPVGVEAEAGFIESFGFRCEVFVAGLKGDPFGYFENIVCFLRNILLFFPPFWITVVDGVKIEKRLSD